MKEKNTLSVSCCESGIETAGTVTAWTETAWVVRQNCDCLDCGAELRLPGLRGGMLGL